MSLDLPYESSIVLEGFKALYFQKLINHSYLFFVAAVGSVQGVGSVNSWEGDTV